MTREEQLERARRAIRTVESSGDYQARGPRVDSGMYAGEQALGGYQVMPGNLKVWGPQHFGRDISEEEYLDNPDLQDEMFNRVFGGYMDNGGFENAASRWHSGVDLATAAKKGRTDGYMRTTDYVDKANNYFDNGVGPTRAAAREQFGAKGRSELTDFINERNLSIANLDKIAAVTNTRFGEKENGLYNWLDASFTPNSPDSLMPPNAPASMQKMAAMKEQAPLAPPFEGPPMSPDQVAMAQNPQAQQPQGPQQQQPMPSMAQQFTQQNPPLVGPANSPMDGGALPSLAQMHTQPQQQPPMPAGPRQQLAMPTLAEQFTGATPPPQPMPLGETMSAKEPTSILDDEEADAVGTQVAETTGNASLIDEEEDTEADAAEKRRKRIMIGNMLESFGVGLGQLSKGAPIDLTEVRGAQMDRRKALAELNGVSGDQQQTQLLLGALGAASNGQDPTAYLQQLEPENVSRFFTETNRIRTARAEGADGVPQVITPELDAAISTLDPRTADFVRAGIAQGGPAATQAWDIIKTNVNRDQEYARDDYEWDRELTADQASEERKTREEWNRARRDQGYKFDLAEYDRAFDQEQGQHLTTAINSPDPQQRQAAEAAMVPSTRAIYDRAMSNPSLQENAERLVEEMPGQYGSVGEAMQYLTRSSQPQINLGDKTRTEAEIKAADNTYSELRDSAVKAARGDALLDVAERVTQEQIDNNSIETGAATPLIKEGLSWAKSVGLEDIANKFEAATGLRLEGLEKLNETQLALAYAVAQANKGQGSVTEHERQEMMRQMPNLLQSKEGRMSLVYRTRAFNEVDRAANNYFNEQMLERGDEPGAYRKIMHEMTNNIYGATTSIVRAADNMSKARVDPDAFPTPELQAEALLPHLTPKQAEAYGIEDYWDANQSIKGNMERLAK